MFLDLRYARRSIHTEVTVAMVEEDIIEFISHLTGKFCVNMLMVISTDTTL